MKAFKDLKIGDYLFVDDYAHRIYSVFNDNGFIVIDYNFFIPYNHAKASIVKVGSNMLFLDVKQWGKYLHKEVDKKVKECLWLQNTQQLKIESEETK